MPEEFRKPHRNWPAKFRDAFQGAALGVRRQNSFAVHFCCAGLVILTAALLRVSLPEWCLLLLCIFHVFTAEMFNSALEVLAKASDTQYNPHLAVGLNIASAAVLVSAIGAVVVGLLILGGGLVERLS